MIPVRRDNRTGQKPPEKASPRYRLSYSLQNGLTLLLAFSSERRALGIAEMANLTGLSRPTTHRYAITLVRLGYLEQDIARRYLLSPGAAAPGSEAIWTVRRAYPVRVVLEELREEIGHTVSMGVLDGTRVTYIHRLFGHRRGQHAVDRELRVGAHIPVYCTALGKVLLASLSESERHERVSKVDLIPQGPRSITFHDQLLAELAEVNLSAPIVSDEEFAVGSRSIAMLISGLIGNQPMAIEVAVPSTAYTVARLRKQLGPPMKRAARLISQM